MKPSKILLHVGHGKTGSSYIQSTLACSVNELKYFDIVYPIEEAKRQSAAKGNTTSGNLGQSEGSWDEMLSLAGNCADKSLLVSSEQLFQTLFNGLESVISERHSGVPVSVLLFVRNPLEGVASSYNQVVKSGGYSGTFEMALKAPAMNRIGQVIKFAEACKKSNYNLTVHNYSDERRNLLRPFAEWLGVPQDNFHMPHAKEVNRSLDSVELEIQRSINNHLGRDAAFVALEMIRRLKPESGTKPKAPRAALERFENITMERIKDANKYFGKELYSWDDIEPYVDASEDEGIYLNKDQLDVVLKALSDRIVKLSGSSRPE